MSPSVLDALVGATISTTAVLSMWCVLSVWDHIMNQTIVPLQSAVKVNRTICHQCHLPQMGNCALILLIASTAVNLMLLTHVAVNFGSTILIINGSIHDFNYEVREKSLTSVLVFSLGKLVTDGNELSEWKPLQTLWGLHQLMFRWGDLTVRRKLVWRVLMCGTFFWVS